MSPERFKGSTDLGVLDRCGEQFAAIVCLLAQLDNPTLVPRI